MPSRLEKKEEDVSFSSETSPIQRDKESHLTSEVDCQEKRSRLPSPSCPDYSRPEAWDHRTGYRPVPEWFRNGDGQGSWWWKLLRERALNNLCLFSHRAENGSSSI